MNNVQDLRPKSPEIEKLAINLGYVDLGQIERLIAEGFYAKRTDLIRSAIRNQLDRHSDAVRQSAARRSIELGLRRVIRSELETARDGGRPINLRVLGLASIADDVTPELARAAIASVSALGALQASAAVKAAIADRLA